MNLVIIVLITRRAHSIQDPLRTRLSIYAHVIMNSYMVRSWQGYFRDKAFLTSELHALAFRLVILNTATKMQLHTLYCSRKKLILARASYSFCVSA